MVACTCGAAVDNRRMRTETVPNLDRTAAEITRPLDGLAVEISICAAVADRSYLTALEHALRAGELLVEAKGQLKHAYWLPWLRDRVELSERDAQNSMRLARRSSTAADLPTLRDAIALLTT
jgi:hypothetical protein